MLCPAADGARYVPSPANELSRSSAQQLPRWTRQETIDSDAVVTESHNLQIETIGSIIEHQLGTNLINRTDRERPVCVFIFVLVLRSIGKLKVSSNAVFNTCNVSLIFISHKHMQT